MPTPRNRTLNMRGLAAAQRLLTTPEAHGSKQSFGQLRGEKVWSYAEHGSSAVRSASPTWQNVCGARCAVVMTVIALVCASPLVVWLSSSYPSTSSKTLRGSMMSLADEARRSGLEREVEAVLSDEANIKKTCAKLAENQTEPYTAKYRDQTIDLEGPVYAYHIWEGVSPKVEIEKHQIDFQKNVSYGDCRLIFKIYEGRLYVYERGYCYDLAFNGSPGGGLRPRYYSARQLVMLAMEVYDLPNMDFVVSLGDSASVHTDEEGNPLPSLSYCIRYGSSEIPGFTLPAYSAFWRTMGDHQMEFYMECLNQRYPRENRTQKAVWRGSTTGTVIRKFDDLMKNRRVSLAHLASQMPELFDVGFSSYAQMGRTDDDIMEFVRSYFPKQGRIPMEDFNNYTVVMDVDGNTWSERLTQLLVANTPVLKQSYDTWIEYFGHLLEDDVHVKFFSPDFSDLASIAAEMTDPDVFTLEDAEERVRNQFNFAKENLSQLGVIRAMAYALLKMKSYTTWEVTMEEGYAKINATDCCPGNERLPQELVARVRARQASYKFLPIGRRCPYALLVKTKQKTGRYLHRCNKLDATRGPMRHPPD